METTTQTPPSFILLNDIVRDNKSYQFPTHVVQDELYYLFLNQEEFIDVANAIFHKLNEKYKIPFGHVFLHIVRQHINELEVDRMTTEEYETAIESLIDKVSKIYLTRIERSSSDGEVITAMIPSNL